MARRKLNNAQRTMKRCSDKSGNTNWKKLGYKNYKCCSQGELKKLAGKAWKGFRRKVKC